MIFIIPLFMIISSIQNIKIYMLNSSNSKYYTKHAVSAKQVLVKYLLHIDHMNDKTRRGKRNRERVAEFIETEKNNRFFQDLYEEADLIKEYILMCRDVRKLPHSSIMTLVNYMRGLEDILFIEGL